MTQALRLLLVLCLAVAGLSVAAKPAAANTTYYLPYPAGTSYQVTQGPGGSTSHYSGTNSVQAIDFGLSAGNAISASAPGTLFKREYHPQLGNMVWLQHSDGYCTLYAHMSSFSSSINGMSVGSSSVSQGAVLGYAGTTGTSTGVHLHFGRVICSGFQTVNVDFAEVANPTEGNSYTSQNNSAAPPAPPVPWSFENLDGDPGSIAQKNSNLGYMTDSINYGGELHSFYYDNDNGNLRHAWSNASGWHFENFDGDPGSIGGLNANLGFSPTTIITAGTLHVFYYDATNGNLRHAWHDASGWHFENFDGDPGSIGGLNGDVGGYTTAAVYNSELHIAYYSASGGNLRHAWRSGGTWHFENLDGDPGSIGHFNADLGISPVMSSYGSTLQLFYHDATNGNLRHAWLDAVGWHFENFDGDPGSIGGLNANLGFYTAVVPVGSTLQLFYHDATNGNLRHAWGDAAGWHFETLDGDATNSVAGFNSSLGEAPTAVAYGADVQLFYYDATNGNLRHAWTDAAGWHFENFDGAGGSPAGRSSGDTGRDPSAIIFNNLVHVFYYDVTRGDWRHAWVNS